MLLLLLLDPLHHPSGQTHQRPPALLPQLLLQLLRPQRPLPITPCHLHHLERVLMLLRATRMPPRLPHHQPTLNMPPPLVYTRPTMLPSASNHSAPSRPVPPPIWPSPRQLPRPMATTAPQSPTASPPKTQLLSTSSCKHPPPNKPPNPHAPQTLPQPPSPSPSRRTHPLWATRTAPSLPMLCAPPSWQGSTSTPQPLAWVQIWRSRPKSVPSSGTSARPTREGAGGCTSCTFACPPPARPPSLPPSRSQGHWVGLRWSHLMRGRTACSPPSTNNQGPTPTPPSLSSTSPSQQQIQQ